MHPPYVLIHARSLLGTVGAVVAPEARLLVALVARVPIKTGVDAEFSVARAAPELLLLSSVVRFRAVLAQLVRVRPVRARIRFVLVLLLLLDPHWNGKKDEILVGYN